MSWLWEDEIETNDKVKSEKEIKIKVLEFDTLWNNYPSNHIEHSGDFGRGNVEDGYDNHCAINVSEAILASNIEIKTVLRKYRCYGSCDRKSSHVVAAQNLANWLKKYPIIGLKKMKKFTGKTYEKKIKGKKGIIFFKDYWQRSNEKGTIRRTGDHIDLWNEGTLASIGSLLSFIRISIGFNYDGYMSDFSKSKEVWFWELK